MLLPESQVSHAVTALDARTLQATEEVPGVPDGLAPAARTVAGTGAARVRAGASLRGTMR